MIVQNIPDVSSTCNTLQSPLQRLGQADLERLLPASAHDAETKAWVSYSPAACLMSITFCVA